MVATSSSPAHIRKRPYQPPISSYFSTRSTNPDISSQLQKPTSSLSLPLPDETQASLLSVGMRVRKSVPEGYKTHKTLGTHAFPFPSSAPQASVPSVQSSGGGVGSRELTPFCGLHKTGGWAAQAVLPSSAPAAMEHNEVDFEIPGMITSQSTLSSTQSSFMSSSSTSPASSRKRTYEEEIEHDLDAYFDDVEDVDPTAQRLQPADRPIARLKSTMPKPGTDRLVCVAGDDFEEATFLASEDGMEVDAA